MKDDFKINNLTFGDQKPVRLMVAFNLSPESFYSGSVVQLDNKYLLEKQFYNCIEEGADIFDFGAKSSAPYDLYGRSTQISSEEEISRLKIVLETFKDLNLAEKALVSIDTQSAQVAEYVLKMESDIINDISGLQHDKKLSKVIADHNAGVVIMASKNGLPGDVHKTKEIIFALKNCIDDALSTGINNQKIIVDPGVGAWTNDRTPVDDYNIINDLPEIKSNLPYPLLIALSRKSFIGKILNLPPNERLYGTLAATSIAILRGANIIRTHDVRETFDVIKIAQEFLKLDF